jgi:hypothetical protein
MAKKRRRPPALPWYARTLSEAQLRAKANQLTADVMRPQQQQLEREAATRNATIAATSKAAADLLASHAGITQGAYNQGAEELKSLGGGYSSAMAARVKGAQDAANEFVKSQGGDSQVPTVDPNALQDVAYHGGVNIPGSSLASQGAAATALDKQMADSNLSQGQWDLRQATQDQEKALLELAQQRPELHDKILQQLQDLEMSKLEFRLKQDAQDLYSAQFGESVRSHVANEQLSRQRNQISKLRYQEQVKQHQLAISQAQAEGRQPNASLSKAYGYIVDAHGNPILDKDGNHIPVAQKTDPKSRSQKAKAQYGKAVGEAESMYRASQPTPNPNAPGDPNLATPPEREWKWGNALRYLMNRYGITRARARQALIAAGFRPPGKPTHAGQGGNYGGRGGQ